MSPRDHPRRSRPDRPQVTICVASFNTRAATELCVRSIIRLAGHPFALRVGDSGSTDGSVTALAAFHDDGLLTLECSPDPRTHAEWLDHWRATCDSEYLLFVDSDLEFRRSAWLRQLMARVRRTRPAIAYAEWLPPSVFTLQGRPAEVVARPAPWLLLLDCQQVSAVDASFAVTHSGGGSSSDPLVIHDVAAALYHEAVAQGLTTVALPRRYRCTYHHYGGLSWLPTSGPRGQKKLHDERTVERRLRHTRRLEHSSGVVTRCITRAALATLPQRILDEAFRIRTGVIRRYNRASRSSISPTSGS